MYQIISANNGSIVQYIDDSFSNILVYDSVQWISYMEDSNKATRTELYANLYNMGGTSE